MATHIPKQADAKSREELLDLIQNTDTKLVLSTGRVIKVGYVYSDVLDKLDRLALEHDKNVKRIEEKTLSVTEGNKRMREYFSKATAAILLQKYIPLKLFWWIKWRIIHHYWNLTGSDYMQIISEAKKKVQQQEYYLAMALLTTMNDSFTIMTTKEATVFLRELKSASEQQQ